MRISVIIATYNKPDWLELVLWGYAAQRRTPAEVIIADDGSDERTRAVVARLTPQLPFPVRHVWHEDDGFRKCTILNEAILAAECEYLLFTDDDCVPRNDFVETHAAHAQRGRFLSGGALKLPMEVSQQLTAADVLSGNATESRWLRAHGMPASRRLARLSAGPLLARTLDALTPTRASFNGGNASAWKSDIIAVNGFDERLRYGGLDRELGERLENAGIRGKQLRHRAILVHLEHSRGYRDENAIRQNRAIRDETAATRRTRTPSGIDGHTRAENRNGPVR